MFGIHTILEDALNRKKDVILAGNFYDFNPGMIGQDTSYGVLLPNRGKNIFKAVPNSKRGIQIEGLVNSMDWITSADGSTNLVVVKNNERVKNEIKHQFMKINKQLFYSVIFLTTFLSSAQKSETTDQIDLKNWKAVKAENQRHWSVVDNVVIGGDGVENIPRNTYLYSDKEYENFEFRCLFRITGDHGKGLINSGIQYRSIIKDNKIIGYQADIGKGYWGDIYDEHRRGKLVGGELGTLKHILNEEGWNSYIIRCIGNKHVTYINGVKTAEYIEKDPNIPSKGVIGIQLHSGGNAKVEFKHITITEL
ncbi:protein of unknown function [Arenibacter palladensis]|uniref:3-keto-alpha-glucoside-1,2-lyase/3-keto-2-hydroxy-glucal hydratase domain-containing protein n=1 Tax=Arenibacter palladensis TaxID=237373 RepID=A0A1M4ZX85_9FLAO|nr:DUF1080 domain-containing protein [Arenibacter palladensis]SHF22649.1 protein of unknown function [Arenibacter palladensis]